MVRLYAWNLGWVAAQRSTGEIIYTKTKAFAQTFLSEFDKELVKIAQVIEHQGHHLDKVKCWE